MTAWVAVLSLALVAIPMAICAALAAAEWTLQRWRGGEQAA
jgi:hypothetical protein